MPLTFQNLWQGGWEGWLHRQGDRFLRRLEGACRCPQGACVRGVWLRTANKRRPSSRHHPSSNSCRNSRNSGGGYLKRL